MLARVLPEHDVDTSQDSKKPESRNLADTALEHGAIERHNLRRVGNGWLGQPGLPGSKLKVARRAGPLELRREGNDHNRCEGGPVQRVALDNENRAPKAGLGAGRLAEVSPPDLALSDYHSDFSRTARAAL